ncbi:hypothetical protein [Halomarina oriensis]|uniref:Uncharacterized protein n=1 Tax=Halomarina oriensis TaxID=671145 RepID=A0A6B0GUH7_9EURY|nr:hypothetical protein [Halomarina oriensis]MWG36243.1 hypothetical protein [Halomarina oriensis]
MSSSNSTALGSRENFWGASEDEYHESGHGPALAGTSYEQYVAHALLAKGATYTCPMCADEHDDHVILEDPSEYPPLSQLVDADGFHVEMYGDHRRHRTCRARGHIVWGGHLQDRPAGEFMEIVSTVLDGIGDVPSSRGRDLATRARRRKQDGMHDKTNMRELVTELRRGPDPFDQ